MRIEFPVSYLFKGVKQLAADIKGNTLHIPWLLHEREHLSEWLKKKETKQGVKEAQHLISHISDDEWCSWKWWHDHAPARPTSAQGAGPLLPQNQQFWPTETTLLSLNYCTVVIANPKLLAPYGGLQAPSTCRSTHSYHMASALQSKFSWAG